jgi:hypothetical protein
MATRNYWTESIDSILSIRAFANEFQESFRTPEQARGPEQDALQRDARHFFDQSRPSQPLLHEPFQRASLPQLPHHQLEEDWNRQFQRINISTPPPSQLLSANQVGKQPDLSISSAWHEEFTSFQSPSPLPQHISFQPQVQQRLASMASTTSFAFEQTSKAPLIDPKFEDEAFELAFAEAESAIHATATIAKTEPVAEEPRLSDEEEADRLAETAGELFDRLQHERDTDEKFRNSTFMALMRKLRDREVVVAGNDMVESSSLHKSGRNGVDESVST